MRIFLEEIEAAEVLVGEEAMAMGEGVSMEEGAKGTPVLVDLEAKVEPENYGRVLAVTEYADLAKARKALMTLAKSRRVRLHLCRHDEGLPCSVEDPFLTQSPMDSDGSARVDGRKPGFFKQGR